MDRQEELTKLKSDPATARWAEIDMLPDEQEALSEAHDSRAVILLPLRSGRIAILDRGGQLHSILDGDKRTADGEWITFDDIRRLSREIKTKLKSRIISTAEARFYGEPNDRDFAKDLKEGNGSGNGTRPTRVRSRTSVVVPLDIEI